MKTRIKNTVYHNGKRYVCRIYDLGRGASPEDYNDALDRYTVAFKGWLYIRGGH